MATPLAILRDVFRQGEAREAAGEVPAGLPAPRPGESLAPYWSGFYHAIATHAIERLEELEGKDTP